MMVDQRIAEFMPVAGSTTAAIVFLTTYRTAELRALLGDTSATIWAYLREAVICTLLPVLTLALLAITLDLAFDAVGALTGAEGFNAPQAGFVLFTSLLVFLLIYQIFLGFTAWAQWNTKRTNA